MPHYRGSGQALIVPPTIRPTCSIISAHHRTIQKTKHAYLLYTRVMLLKKKNVIVIKMLVKYIRSLFDTRER